MDKNITHKDYIIGSKISLSFFKRRLMENLLAIGLIFLVKIIVNIVAKNEMIITEGYNFTLKSVYMLNDIFCFSGLIFFLLAIFWYVYLIMGIASGIDKKRKNILMILATINLISTIILITWR